jgi:hypothetical protein
MPDETRTALQPASVEFPRMWAGYAAIACSAAFAITEHRIDASNDGPIISGLTDLAPSIYWYFAVWRFHKVLRQATGGRYPIGPWKAVLYQLIPFYHLFWAYKWPNQVARFVPAAKSRPIARRRPGCLILVGVMAISITTFNVIPFEISLGLSSFGFLILFITLHYLTERLRPAIILIPRNTDSVPSAIHTARPFRAMFSAGIGAATGYLLARAIAESIQNRNEVIGELIVIAVVSILVIFFIEPVLEWVKAGAGLPTEHAIPGLSLRLKIIAVSIPIIAFLLHGLLHHVINHHGDDGPWWAAAMVLRALILAGGITIGWIYGCRRQPSCASRLGAVNVVLLWCGFLLLLWLMSLKKTPNGLTAFVSHIFSYLTSSEPGIPLSKGEIKIILGVLPWLVAAITGGLMIERRWLARPCVGIVVGIFVAVLAMDALSFLVEVVSLADLRDDLGMVAGWGLALLVMGPRTLGVHGGHAPARGEAVEIIGVG